MPTFRAGFPLNLTPQFEELRDEIDRVWTSLTSAPPLHGWAARAAGVFPAVNVHETDEAITVEAELPGLDAGDVDISVADDELVLKGSRPECPPAEAAERKPGRDGFVEGQPEQFAHPAPRFRRPSCRRRAEHISGPRPWQRWLWRRPWQGAQWEALAAAA